MSTIRLTLLSILTVLLASSCRKGANESPENRKIRTYLVGVWEFRPPAGDTLGIQKILQFREGGSGAYDINIKGDPLAWTQRPMRYSIGMGQVHLDLQNGKEITFRIKESIADTMFIEISDSLYNPERYVKIW